MPSWSKLAGMLEAIGVDPWIMAARRGRAAEPALEAVGAAGAESGTVDGTTA